MIPSQRRCLSFSYVTILVPRSFFKSVQIEMCSESILPGALVFLRLERFPYMRIGLTIFTRVFAEIWLFIKVSTIQLLHLIVSLLYQLINFLYFILRATARLGRYKSPDSRSKVKRIFYRCSF